jgi:hypothetical protein
MNLFFCLKKEAAGLRQFQAQAWHLTSTTPDKIPINL